MLFLHFSFSAFLCNSNSELAKLYNDITVLENHHAALGFKLTTSDDRVNILKNLDRESYKNFLLKSVSPLSQKSRNTILKERNQ